MRCSRRWTPPKVPVQVENVDDAPTLVAVTSPVDAEVVSGITVVAVDAADAEDDYALGVGMLTVEVSIDAGVWLPAAWNGGSGRYELVWNTTGYADATHTLDVRATDSGVNTLNGVQVIPSVDNSNPNAYADAVLADGPVAYWRLGELSGTTAVDATGRGNDGSYVSSPTLGVPGVVARTLDTAVDFDGVSDLVSVGGYSDVNLGGPYSEKTVELWFDADSVTARQVLYEQGGVTRGLNVYVEGGVLYAGAWNIANDGPGTPWGATWVTVPVSVDTQHHVVMVLDDVGDRLELFLDGVSVDVASGVGPLFAHGSQTGIGATYQWVRFQDDSTAGSGFEFDGTIDDVALYNSLLSAGQVQAHYLLGVEDQPPTVALVAPADASTVAGSSVTVQVNATDAEDFPGSLTVEVSIDGGTYVSASSVGGTLYEFSWDTTSEVEGVHTIDARATDSGGHLVSAVQFSVNVDNVDDAPVVALTLPVDLSEVNGSVVVQVDASDDRDAEGSLTVEVSVDGGAFVAASSVGGTLYELVWDTTLESEGPHTVDARATDVFPNVVDGAGVGVGGECECGAGGGDYVSC